MKLGDRMMVLIACVFPGQGSQIVGMGKELASAFASARDVFAEIDDVLDQHLTRLIFEGPQEELTLTHNAQPALMAVSMAVIRVLEQEASLPLTKWANYVLGHSLGEYAALAASKVLSLADTARLLRIRGEAMQRACLPGVGAMAAILGLEIEDVKQLVIEAAYKDEQCVLANDNAPGQIVISGHVGAVDRVIIAAKALGKKAVLLPVSAPFHSPLMQPAAAIMEEALAKVTMHNPVIPIIPNVLVQLVRDAELLRKALIDQVAGQVRWRESLLYLKALGVEGQIECGAGKVLSGLAKRTISDWHIGNIAVPSDVDQFVKQYA
jgi:[acyl-carrier-protein] S-malonyltransferase